MAYKSYAKQIAEHLEFLRAKNFNINELVVNPTRKEIRCCAADETHGRGKLAYRCTPRRLNNDLLGLGTWCRGLLGEEDYFMTYGLWPDSDNSEIQEPFISRTQMRESEGSHFDLAARRAYGFWIHSAFTEKSDYLDKKGVGYYGLRFRRNRYGNVAVVPMRDEFFRLWSYQLLNPDGSKRFAKGAKTIGLQHALGKLVDSKPIGISESYVTAATCMELTNIPTVCAFSSENLIPVSEILRKKYPSSHIYILADNDRHLSRNIGIQKAQEAFKALKTGVSVIAPEFGEITPSGSASDWNDLVRMVGIVEAKCQIQINIFTKRSVNRARENNMK